MPLITRNSQNANVKLGTTAQLAAITFTDGDLASDTTLNKVKVFNGVSLAEIGTTSFSSSAVVSQSTTIGDFTTPSSATASSSAEISPTLEDDFTSYTTQAAADAVWVSNDTAKIRVDITNDNYFFTENTSSQQTLISRDIGTANINATNWIVRFYWKLNAFTQHTTAGNNCKSEIGFGSALSTGEDPANDFMGIRIVNNQITNTLQFMILLNDGATRSLGTIHTVTGSSSTEFYIQLKRNGNSCVLTLFSDSNYTTIVYTDTISLASIDNLRYFRHYLFTQSTNGVMNGTVDDFKFYNNVSTTDAYPATNVFDNNTATKWLSISQSNPNIYVDMGSALNLCAAAFYFNSTDTTNTEILIQSSADASTWTTRRTITESDLTDGAYNYYRFNIAGGARYIRFYGNSAGSTVLSIWEIKILKKTDAEIFNDLGILTITASDTTLGPDGT